MKDFIVETSARHCHLSQNDLDILFGKNYNLTVKKNLSQPGQFLCNEKVTIVGEKKEITVSILGPTRKNTQVELALTDARNIGVVAPIRESGDLSEAGACKIIGPKGEVSLEHTVIAAKRHIHATCADAKELGVKNGDIVAVSVNSPERKLIFEDVVVRVSDDYNLAMHIDTDESNACFNTTRGYIINLRS